MKANYHQESRATKKGNALISRYISEYLTLCMIYGDKRAMEILQERHEGSKNNGILLDSNQQQI